MTAAPVPAFRCFVALGDSTTEGVGDRPHADGTERGWADRFAAHLVQSSPGLLYANLAVRGRRAADVREQQLPVALSLEPDLASVIVGVNDLIRPGADLDAALAHVDETQRRLREAGATVLTATFPDRSSSSTVARLVRGRFARFNAGLREIAATHGTLLADLEASTEAADPRLWCDDRLHLSPEGHAQLAGELAAVVLGAAAPAADAGAPVPVPAVGRSIAADVRWARRFLLPWIGRRLTGRSSGDGRHAKRPEPLPIAPPR